MKKLIILTALISGMFMSANAQKNKQGMKDVAPAERAKNEAMRAEKKLTLTADQKIKWETASLERINANAPIRTKLDGSTTGEERKLLHAQMRVNKLKFDGVVSAMLTPEQKLKFNEMKKGMKGKGKEKDKIDENMDGE